MVIRERFSYQGIHQVLGGLLGEDLHAKRVGSLCDATLGGLHSGSLAICAIGQGLAAARSLKPKHAVEQNLPPRRRGSTVSFPIPPLMSMTSCFAGCRSSLANLAPSWSPWTGQISMPTIRPPSCWH